jgi:hypothetical protein
MCMSRQKDMELKNHNIGVSYTLYLTILSNWPVYLQFNKFLNGMLKAFIINSVELGKWYVVKHNFVTWGVFNNNNNKFIYLFTAIGLLPGGSGYFKCIQKYEVGYY